MFVSKHLKILFLHRNWNLDRPELAKVILVETYLDIPTRPSRKLQLWIFISGSELTLSFYYRTLTVESLWFYSFYRLDFFNNFFLSDIRFFFKIKCCMFNLSFLSLLDGKYRIVTAPLVFSWNQYAIPELPL